VILRGWLSRKQLAEVAKELADHLLLIDHVKALQTGQKELADAIALLGQRLHQIEAQIQTVRADTKLDAIREAQTVINVVQGSLNQRIETLAVKLAVQEVKGDAASRLPVVVQEGKGDAASRLPVVVQEGKSDATPRLPAVVQEGKGDAASRLPVVVQEGKSDATPRLPSALAIPSFLDRRKPGPKPDREAAPTARETGSQTQSLNQLRES